MNEVKIAIGGIVAIGFFLLFILLKPFTIIGAGERGVVMNWGKVQEYVLGEGLHFYTPIVTSVKRMSVRVQKEDVKAEAASKDLQDVNMDIVVNYHLDPERVNIVYQTIGDNKDVYERIISPNTNEVVKSATSEYTAEEIIQRRQELKDHIDSRLIERLASYGVVLDDVSLVNVDFSEEFNHAIEAKQVAEQQAQQAKFTAQRAEAEAQAAINKARGDAEAQRLQQQTLTPLILQQQAITKWNGSFPQYFGGNVLPFLNIGQ